MKKVAKAQTDTRTNQELKESFERLSHGIGEGVIDALIENITDAFTEAEKKLAALLPEMVRRKLI